MSGNPTLNRMIRQTIYDLKHRFGGEITVYKVVDSDTDYKTGVKTINATSRAVRKAIILPNLLTREIFQGISYLSASKSFASLGGQGWDEATRSFIVDGADLKGYAWDLEDWIVYRGKRYDIETIEELEWDTGWLIVAKEVKGQVSGGGPRIIIESGASDFNLSHFASAVKDIPVSTEDEIEFFDPNSGIMEFNADLEDSLGLTDMQNVSSAGQIFEGGESELTLTDQATELMDFLKAVSDALALSQDVDLEHQMNFMAAWDGYALSTPDNPASSLDDFTYYIDLSQMPGSWWSAVKSDGGDIRASKDDDATELPVDVIHFNYGANTGLIAVKYTGTKTTSNQPIRVYAGNAAASLPAANDTYGSENAYASHFVGVWPDGGGTDRTANSNDFTNVGSPTIGGVAGPFGGTLATDWDGSTQYGSTTVALPSTYPVSFLSWFNPDINTGNQDILHLNNGTGNTQGMELRLNSDPKVIVRSNGSQATESTTYSLSTWQSAFGAVDTSTARKAGRNGGNIGTDTGTNTVSGCTTLWIAAIGNAAHGGKVNGKLSLCEFHNIYLSNDWYAYWHAMGNQATFYNGWNWN